MKVIFLDIDGVLNSGISRNEYKSDNPYKKSIRVYMPHPIHLDNLQYIIEYTDAKVVISSAQRVGCSSLHMWNAFFFALGYENIDVVGVTPSAQSSVRGDDIQMWLDKNESMSKVPYLQTHVKPVESFVILDDDSDMGHLMGNLVLVNGVEGLAHKNALEAIKILNA